MGKFEIRRTSAGLVFHLKARNGETIAVSQRYASMEGCYKGIASVIRHAPHAAVEDQTQRDFAPEKNPKFEIYRDRAGRYRFRLVARNGQNIASGGGYSTKENCRKGIESLRRQCTQQPPEIVVQDMGAIPAEE